MGFYDWHRDCFVGDVASNVMGESATKVVR